MADEFAHRVQRFEFLLRKMERNLRAYFQRFKVFAPQDGKTNVTLHHEMSRNVPDGHFHVFIFSESKFYAVYNGENHFRITGLVAKLNVFEYGGATFGTFEKTYFKC